ncbi:MAG: hypothetical protein ACYSUX_00815, partial [Planctomycetota bacterium]
MENANFTDKKNRILISVFACVLLAGQNFSVVCAGQSQQDTGSQDVNEALQGAPKTDKSVVNRVLSLDGDGDYVRIADTQSLHSFSDAITIEVWVKASSFYTEH